MTSIKLRPRVVLRITLFVFLIVAAVFTMSNLWYKYTEVPISRSAVTTQQGGMQSQEETVENHGGKADAAKVFGNEKETTNGKDATKSSERLKTDVESTHVDAESESSKSKKSIDTATTSKKSKLSDKKSPVDTAASKQSYAFEYNSNPPSHNTTFPWSAFNPFITTNRANADTEKLFKVRDMMRHAWSGYIKYASLTDELCPVSKRGRNWYPQHGMLFTPIDALDTLWIMGLTEEYYEARDMILKHLNTSIPEYINLFETTIRVVGGLLSAYDLTGDPAYIPIVTRLADRMLPAFDTPTGIPNNQINLQTGDARRDPTACLAELGTLQLEFQYLSDITGNPVYQDTAFTALERLYKAKKPIPGLFPLRISVNTGDFMGDGRYSVAGEGDSFYEYILKLYVSTGDKKYLDRFHTIAQSIKKHIAVITHDEKGAYLPTRYSDLKPESSTFGHLSCFAGGMYALGAVVDPKSPHATEYETLARQITYSCGESYTRSSTGLGGEDVSGQSLTPIADTYILRPEVVESLFYMWRLTHDQQYRDRGWKMVEALEKHCRNDAGYHGLHHGSPDDTQHSFFLAETLKYLYLLFSDDDVIPLEKYVFNTEAHPVSVRGFGRRSDPNTWMKLKSAEELLKGKK